MGILWAENESLSSVRVNPNRKRERDWRSQSLRVASSSRCWIRLLRRSLGNGAGKNRVEHSSRVVPVVVAEHVLVQVGLKPLGGYAVIHAPKTVLQVCPETVNSAGVYIPLDIHLRRVIDAPMFVTEQDGENERSCEVRSCEFVLSYVASRPAWRDPALCGGDGIEKSDKVRLRESRYGTL